MFCPKPGLFRRPTRPEGARRVLEPGVYAERPEAYDACFYHLGNNPYHEYIYYAARRRPEIAVFHDAVLHHLIAHVTIEQGGDPGGYEGILHGEYGARGTRLAQPRSHRSSICSRPCSRRPRDRRTCSRSRPLRGCGIWRARCLRNAGRSLAAAARRGRATGLRPGRARPSCMS